MRTGIAVSMGAALILATFEPVGARAFPSVLMFYGGGLDKPVFATPQSVPEAEAQVPFWCGYSSMPPQSLVTDRPYVSLAVFWISFRQTSDPAQRRALLAGLKSENAQQHGRLYVARPGVRAAAVLTPLARTLGVDPATRFPIWESGRPPTLSTDFTHGCWLSDADLETARALGVPLRN